MAKGSDLLVAALENEGVDRIFGIPGEENLDFVESFYIHMLAPPLNGPALIPLSAFASGRAADKATV